jgi:hypothetical protein
MNEMNLSLTGDERECLVELLDHILDEVRVEEHRTRTLSYRESVLNREHLIESVLGKLKQWSPVAH